MEHIDRFDPLAISLRRPAATRLLSAGGSLALEALCYLGVLACIAAAVFSKTIYPSLLLSRFERSEYSNIIGPQNVQNLRWLYLGMLALIALLFLLLARSLRQVRIKNSILARTGTSVRSLVEDLLRRRAAIAAFEQRHGSELEWLARGVPAPRTDQVNTAPNPGFDGAANRSFDR